MIVAVVLVDVLEVLPGILGMLGQVEVGAVVDTLELLEAHGELELDVVGVLGVMGKLLVVVPAELGGADSVFGIVAHPLFPPVFEEFLVVPGLNEELHLHLLKLAGPEDEVFGHDLVAEGLSHLGDPEGNLEAVRLGDILVVHVDALGRLGPEVDHGGGIFRGADGGLEHEVKGPGLRKGAAALGALAGRYRLGGNLGVVVGAEAALAVLAVHQGIGKIGHVP